MKLQLNLDKIKKQIGHSFSQANLSATNYSNELNESMEVKLQETLVEMKSIFKDDVDATNDKFKQVR